MTANLLGVVLCRPAMYIHRMRRTQLYLDQALHKHLKTLARRRGRTLSELVREALVTVYGPVEIDDRVITLRNVTGLWRNRKDLGDTHEYVRRLRRDTRMTCASSSRPSNRTAQ
jgi:hypothetical protein